MSAGEHESRFGASADIRFEQSIEALVEFLTDRGLNHIELRQGYLDLNSPTPAELRSLAADYGVTFTVGTRWMPRGLTSGRKPTPSDTNYVRDQGRFIQPIYQHLLDNR